jgi:hypothetical protein
MYKQTKFGILKPMSRLQILRCWLIEMIGLCIYRKKAAQQYYTKKVFKHSFSINNKKEVKALYAILKLIHKFKKFLKWGTVFIFIYRRRGAAHSKTGSK